MSVRNESRPAHPAVGLSNGTHAGIVIMVASMGFFLITLDIPIVNVAWAQIRPEPTLHRTQGPTTKINHMAAPPG